MKQVQTDYEKRLREVEAQRTQLLDEMESRETRLITKVTDILPTCVMSPIVHIAHM